MEREREREIETQRESSECCVFLGTIARRPREIESQQVAVVTDNLMG